MQKLLDYLEPIYGAEASKELVVKIQEYAGSHTLDVDFTGAFDPYWYKHVNMYIVYPDGIAEPAEKPPLQRIHQHLDWVEKTGCNAVHVLPFLDSPLIDKGFDIRNFYEVRPDLGTRDDVLKIVKTARNKGMHVFMDLVFNHISDEHEWFQKAQSGDEYYRNFFLHTNEKPEFIRKYTQDSAVWAEYKVEGELKSVFVMFPELTGEIPHWRQGTDGYWYYHTFYPQQPDIDWFNPEVFLEFSKILIFWTSHGLNFRFDAIPFIGKKVYKDAAIDSPTTHQIINALRYIAHSINPECALLVETFERLENVISYFGTTNTPRSHLSYNFHLCAHLWATLVKKDSTFLWEILARMMQIPKHAEWINFLRNHDELSLSYLPESVQKETIAELIKNGYPFREGQSVGGRTFSLLGQDSERFLMAYTLLASLPGALGIPYGDEIAKKSLELTDMPEIDRKDTRNTNRGILQQAEFESEFAKTIYQKISYILHNRPILKDYIHVDPTPVPGKDPELFACSYKIGTSVMYVFVNLSESEKTVPFMHPEAKTILTTNTASRTDSDIILGRYGCLWIES